MATLILWITRGGRKGALQYDIASLLFDAKADLPSELRGQLLEYYLDELVKYIEVKREEFKHTTTTHTSTREYCRRWGRTDSEDFTSEKPIFCRACLTR